jgi:hypothetical protein
MSNPCVSCARLMEPRAMQVAEAPCTRGRSLWREHAPDADLSMTDRATSICRRIVNGRRVSAGECV